MKRSGGGGIPNHTNTAYHHHGSTSVLGGGGNVRGMTALSVHAPKPVQTSSLKKENGGQDVNFSIVKGKVGWASTPPVHAAPAIATSNNNNAFPERASLSNTEQQQQHQPRSRSQQNEQSSSQTAITNEKQQQQQHLDHNSPWSESAQHEHDMGRQPSSTKSSSPVRASRWGNVNLDASIDNLPTHHYGSHHHQHYGDYPPHSSRYHTDGDYSHGSPTSSPGRRRGSGSGYHSYGSGGDVDYLHRDHHRGSGGNKDADYLHRDHGPYNHDRNNDDGGRYSNFHSNHHRSDYYHHDREGDRDGGYDRSYRTNTDHYSSSYRSRENYNDDRNHSSSSSWGERRTNASTTQHPPLSPPSSPLSRGQHQLPEKSEEDIILQAVREREAAEARSKLKREQEQKELEQEKQKQQQQQQQEKEATKDENGAEKQSEEMPPSSPPETPELEDQEHSTSGSEEEEEEEEEASEHHLRWGDIDDDDDDDDDESYTESSDNSHHDAHVRDHRNDYYHNAHARCDSSDHRSHTDYSHASSGDNAHHHLNWRAEALHDSGPAGNGGFRNYTIANNRRQHSNYQQPHHHYPPYEQHPTPRSPPRQEHTNYQIYKRPSSPPMHASYNEKESDTHSPQIHKHQQEQHDEKEQQQATVPAHNQEPVTNTSEPQQEKKDQNQQQEVLSEEEIERRRKEMLEQQQQSILLEVAAKRNAAENKKKPRREHQSNTATKKTEHIPGFEGSRPIAPEDEEKKAARLEHARTRGPRTKGILFLRLEDGTLARKAKDGTLVPKEMHDREDGKRKGRDGKRRGKPKEGIDKHVSDRHGVEENKKDQGAANQDEPKLIPAPVPVVSAWKFGPPQGTITTDPAEEHPDTYNDSGNRSHNTDDVDPSSQGHNANAPSWNPVGHEGMDSEQKKFAAVAPIMGSWDNFVSRAPGLDGEQQHWDDHHHNEDSHGSFPDPHAAVPHDLFSSGDETGKTDQRGSQGSSHNQSGKPRRIPPYNSSNKVGEKKKYGNTEKRPYNPKNKKRSGSSFRAKDGKDNKNENEHTEESRGTRGPSTDKPYRSTKKESHTSSKKYPKRPNDGKKNQTSRPGAGGSNKPGSAKDGYNEQRKKGSRPTNTTKPRKPRAQRPATDADSTAKGVTES